MPYTCVCCTYTLCVCPLTVCSMFPQAMPLIIKLMEDPSTVVRDSAAWTVGRVCELLPEEAINPAYLSELVSKMLTCLSAEPRVAANSCWVSSGAVVPVSYRSNPHSPILKRAALSPDFLKQLVELFDSS